MSDVLETVSNARLFVTPTNAQELQSSVEINLRKAVLMSDISIFINLVSH